MKVKNSLKIFIITLIAVLLFAPTAFAANATCDDCIRGSINPVAAAFGTEGLWAQSNLLTKLGEDGEIAGWAPLLYMIAIISGIIMMAMGQPPKMYVWFMLGPAMYHILLFSTEDARGLTWVAGEEEQDMKVVWRLAEAGMNNSGLTQFNATFTADDGPSKTTKVAHAFVVYNNLISGTIETLIKWSGAFDLKDPGSGTKAIHKKSFSDERMADKFLMSNVKWSLLDDITSSTLHDADIRDSLVYFMSSKCGDQVSNYVDTATLIAAGSSKGQALPVSSFVSSDLVGPSNYMSAYKPVFSALDKTLVPAPRSIRNMLNKGIGQNGTHTASSLRSFLKEGGKSDNDLTYFATTNDLYCSDYLWMIMQGFRWEAANTVNHITTVYDDAGASNVMNLEGIGSAKVIYSLLYGWTFSDKSLDENEQKQFVIYMVLAHMFRNEMKLAKSPIDQKYLTSQNSQNASDTFIRELGGRSKWQDLFTAYKIFPHIQGLLLYFLIMGYPIVCMLMVLPGFWKAMWSWMGFYAWVKSWDLGLAIVISLEKSVWARIGNSKESEMLNNFIKSMSNGKNLGMTAGNFKIDATCSGANYTSCSVKPAGGFNTYEALYLFDQGLLVANSLSYDLNNGYYIYIMSALYLAIPTVSGQLLTKGKSSMVSSLMGAAEKAGQDGSRAAQQAVQGRKLMDADNSFETAGQAAFIGAASAKDSFAAKSLASQNRAMAIDANKGSLGVRQKMLGDEYGFKQGAINELGKYANAKTALKQAEFQTMAGAVQGIQAAFDGMSPGGGAGGKGTGKGTPGGQTGQAIGSVPAAMRKALGMALYDVNARGHAAGALINVANLEWGNQAARTDKEGKTKSADMSVEGYMLGMEENAEKSMAGRYRSAGEQEAGEARWGARRDLGNQYATRMGALGASPGRYSAGSRPSSIEGMAGTGQLGNGQGVDGRPVEDAGFGFSDGFNYANWDGGGFRGAVGEQETGIDVAYGAAYIDSWKPGDRPFSGDQINNELFGAATAAWTNKLDIGSPVYNQALTDAGQAIGMYNLQFGSSVAYTMGNFAKIGSATTNEVVGYMQDWAPGPDKNDAHGLANRYLPKKD